MDHSHLASAQSYRVQKTLRRPVEFEGVGLHTGIHTRLKLLPAPPNHGILFERKDASPPARILAHYDAVVSTDLATSLGYRDREDARISTIEHLSAALYAMGITNLVIEVWGPEIPILDGSAAPYLAEFLEAGLEFQPVTTPTLRVLKPIKIYEKGAVCELLPRDRLRLTTSIDFPHPAIGLQTFALDVTPLAFLKEIAQARTFGFLKDVEALQRKRLALGASLDNVLAFSDEAILNPGGSRFPDECVRHKLLDAMGDLALCGCWIEGELVSFRGGHSIHLALLQALRKNRSYWEIVPASPLPSFVDRTSSRPAWRGYGPQ